MTEEERWTPVRRGDVYCSPACGNNCTVYDFEAAHTNAQALVSVLGPKWKPRVWENLGWHYAAVLYMEDIDCHATVHVSKYNGETFYHCLIGTGDMGGWPVHEDKEDSRKAQTHPLTALYSAWKDLARDIEFDKDDKPDKDDRSEEAFKWRIVNYLEDLMEGSGWQKRRGT